MDLICHLAGNKNVIKKFELVEKLKRNNKGASAKQLPIKLELQRSF